MPGKILDELGRRWDEPVPRRAALILYGLYGFLGIAGDAAWIWRSGPTRAAHLVVYTVMLGLAMGWLMQGLKSEFIPKRRFGYQCIIVVLLGVFAIQMVNAFYNR